MQSINQSGIWNDNKLKFTGYVSHIVAKGSQLLGLIVIICAQRCGCHQDIEVFK